MSQLNIIPIWYNSLDSLVNQSADFAGFYEMDLPQHASIPVH